MAVEIGSYVQVLDRAPTPADQKSGLFYNHFRFLAGTVDRVYEDGCLCVVVDHGSLSREMLSRLKRAERIIKPRWKSGPGALDAAPDPAAVEAGSEDEDEAVPSAAAAEDGGSGYIAGRPVTAAVVAEETTGDIHVNPGLRYAIVIKQDDVQEIRPSDRVLPPTRETLPAVRASEEDIKAAEARFMAEMHVRAEKQKQG